MKYCPPFMATRKTRAKSTRSGPNKSAFIRQHQDLSASEVAAKAAEAGITVSPAFVHAVRSKVKTTANRTAGPPTSNGKGPSETRSNASGFVKEQLKAGKTPGEIVAAGKVAGFKFSRSLVYAVKSSTRSGATAGRRPGRRPAQALSPSTDLAAFKRIALELGITRAKRELDDWSDDSGRSSKEHRAIPPRRRIAARGASATALRS